MNGGLCSLGENTKGRRATVRIGCDRVHQFHAHNRLNTDATAVLFDFGEPLDADGIAWKDRVPHLFADAGVVVPRERFDRVFHAADDALVGALPPTLSLADTVGRLVTAVADALGVADRAVADGVARRFLAAAQERLGENAALLERLPRRPRVRGVSHFSRGPQRAAAGAGLGRRASRCRSGSGPSPACR